MLLLAKEYMYIVIFIRIRMAWNFIQLLFGMNLFMYVSCCQPLANVTLPSTTTREPIAVPNRYV